MGKLDADKVKVPADVLVGLIAVRDSGRTNMFDRRAVQEIALEMGHDATAFWVAETGRGEYAAGILHGFEADDE